jgi:serine/threonine protein kinase
LSSKLEEDGVGAKSRVGTFTYSSEEKFQGVYYDSRDDIWALGCIFLELLVNYRLANHIPRPSAPESRILLDRVLSTNQSLNPSLIVGKCLIANYKERPHATLLWAELEHMELRGAKIPEHTATALPVSHVNI